MMSLLFYAYIDALELGTLISVFSDEEMEVQKGG